MNLTFTHQLPLNSGMLKKATFSLVGVLALSVIGYFVSQLFYDDYTYPCYSIRYRVHTRCGWPATIQNWSIWFILGTGFVLPFMIFMQDWRYPSAAITRDGLFLNQQLIRSTLVPFNNIKEIKKVGDSYTFVFHDPKPVIRKQFFLFRPFVKYNLNNNNFFLSETHSSGNMDEFMNVLSEKSGVPIS